MKRYLAILFALAMVTMVIPAGVAASDDERTEYKGQDAYDEFEARKAQMMEDLQAPSSLSMAEATDLLLLAYQGEAIEQEDGLELFRYLRDTQEQPALQQALFHDVLYRLVDEKLDEAAAQAPLAAQPMDAPAQSDTWDELTVPLTAGYLAAGTVESNFLPHNVRVPGVHVATQTVSGQVGSFPSSSGYFFLRATADLLAMAALDMHSTTDTALAQLPVSVEVRLYWACDFWWGIPICVFYPGIAFPETLIASDATFELAVPEASGQLATRATDNDIFQVAYDALGTLDYRSGREWTSAALTRGTDAQGQVPGGEPGIGDVHAASPIPDFYGLQADPLAGPTPILPPTPADGEAPVQEAREMYADTHIRYRAPFSVPGDSTGQTAGYELDQIRAWHLNIAILRMKNLGTGMTPLGEAPASFYYDAASYFTGGGGTVWLQDYSIADSPTSAV